MTARPASLAILLCAVLVLMLAGCGGDDETTNSSSGAAATSTQDADADQGEEQGEDGDSEEEREREEQEAQAAGGKDCGEAGDLDGTPELELPADLKVPASAHIYASEGPFGKTERFLAVVEGTPEDLASVRDEAQQELVGAGFTSLSTDQEEGAEAEAHLKGPDNTIDIQVAPLCDGKVRIRYTVS